MIRSRKYVLELLGLRVGLDFPDSEQEVLRSSFYGRLEDYWQDFFVKVDDKRIDWWLKWQFNPIGLKMKLEEKTRWLEWFEERKNEWNVKVLIGMESFNFMLRQLWLRLVWENGGLGLHGSAVEKDGIAYVFLAASGVGKSTTARILEEEGFSHLADDMVLLRKIDDEWILAGSPVIEKSYLPVKWQGERFRLFFLERGELVGVDELSEREKLKRLLSQTWTYSEGEFRFEWLVDLIQNAEIKLLTTNLDYKNKIKEVINAAS